MPARRPKRRAQPAAPLDVDRLLHSVARIERRGSGEWHVQPMAATSAVKEYVCPGCGGTVPQGTAHLVVWRADSIFADRAIEDRRHWHSGCWRAH